MHEMLPDYYGDTAFKRHLCYIQSEKIAPEGYPSISSNNFIKEYAICEEGKRSMRNFKAFVKTHPRHLSAVTAVESLQT